MITAAELARRLADLPTANSPAVKLFLELLAELCARQPETLDVCLKLACGLPVEYTFRDGELVVLEREGEYAYLC